MKKLILLVVTALMTMLYATAEQAVETPLNYKQSDGTVITVQLVGDEWFHTFTTTDGYTLSRDAKGDFYYSTPGGVSKVMAHNIGQRSATEQSFINANAQLMSVAQGVPSASRKMAASRANASKRAAKVPHVGTPKVPIILVNYSDFSLKSKDPVTTFKNHFSQGSGSVYQYFIDQSLGAFTPQFDILGPVNLSHTRAYYGTDSEDGKTHDMKIGSMVAEAVKGLPDVDFSQYDNDGDGAADVVIILYAGPGQSKGASSQTIWPCAWDLHSAYYYGRSDYDSFKQNGVTINKFSVFNETSGSSDYTTTLDGIGTFCHEFSHCLGLPDFYDTEYGGHYGMGTWDLMGSGNHNNSGKTPAGYTAYEKNFMKWMDLITPESNTKYTLKSMDQPDATAIKIVNDQDPNEYYILECHKKTGWYAYNKGNGLMALHVTYNSSSWSSNVVNNYDLQCMTLFPADNKLTSASEAGDLYPYNGNNSLTDFSTPAATLNKGSKKLMGKPITDISYSNGVSTFWYWKDYVKDVPTMIAVEDNDIAVDSCKLSWEGVENARSYDLELSSEEADGMTFKDIAGTNYIVKNLIPGATYSARVMVNYTDETCSDWCEPISFTLKSNPVLLQAASGDITGTSFKATWQPLAHAQSYTLHIRRDGYQNFTQLLHETFGKCVKNATTNIGSQLGNYTDNAGWAGSYIYQAIGGIKIGATGKAGSLRTPKMDFSNYDGKVVVKITAATNGSATDCDLTVTTGGQQQTITVPDNQAKEYTLIFMTDGLTDQTITLGAAGGKNVVVTNVDVFGGDADDVMNSKVQRRSPAIDGNQDDMVMTGITDTCYTVSGLAKSEGYRYLLKALFDNGTESWWSNVNSVTLLGGAVTGDVTGDGIVDISDVNAVISVILGQEPAEKYEGRADVNVDGTVDVVDLNMIISIILS
ncbi:MAG: M6 family metalloprotease domain-containing protein [Bacteroidales bacterium]|nr:M6 family metalloprotease domain-containing protein [Candidatus Sodaliphilus aphodohippi]